VIIKLGFIFIVGEYLKLVMSSSVHVMFLIKLAVTLRELANFEKLLRAYLLCSAVDHETNYDNAF
jgi:hypothetical protein